MSDSANTAAWITAVTTVVYTAGTFMLWWATNQSIKLTKSEIKRKEELLTSNFVSKVYRDFRELYMSFLEDSDMLKQIATERGSDDKAVKIDYMGSFLINHAFEIYGHHQQKILPEEFWKHIVSDIAALFEWGFIKARWEKVAIYYPENFRQFINTEILKSKIISKMETPKIIYSTDDCNTGSCPTVYQTERKTYLIQGKKMSLEEKQSLNIPADEDVIEIPEDFLKGFTGK